MRAVEAAAQKVCRAHASVCVFVPDSLDVYDDRSDYGLGRLLVGKLLVCGLISLFLGLICTVFTIFAGFLTGFPGLSAGAAVQGLIQITLLNLFLYISVMPIIILTSRSANGFPAGVIIAFAYGYGGMFAAGSMKLANLYPITASLGMINYRSYEVHWNTALCCLSMAVTLSISAALILSMPAIWRRGNPRKIRRRRR